MEINPARPGLPLGSAPSTHSAPGPPISGSILPPVSPPPSASQQVQLEDSKSTSALRRGSSAHVAYSASSIPSRDLWQEALKRLSEKDRALVLRHFSPGIEQDDSFTLSFKNSNAPPGSRVRKPTDGHSSPWPR